MSTSFISTTLDWAAYLHHPPPASWIARTAATFRILALLLILPCIFLTALVSYPRLYIIGKASFNYHIKDVASYLVVRTLGADSAHRLDPATATPGYSPDSRLDDLSGPAANHHDSPKPSVVVVPSEFDESSTKQTHSETCFATSSDANFALAGEGIFSPPGSRSGSPPITRSSRATGIGGIPEGEETAVLRKRG
jgi:hypothetical protein